MMDADMSITPAAVAPAIQSGDLSTIRSIYPPGSRDLNTAVGRRGVSAYNLAAIEGQLPILEYLVGIGCDLDHEDTDHFNSAHLASWYGHSHILDYLGTVRPQLFRSTRIPNLPIHVAAYREHANAIRSCAPHCDINQKNRDHLTPLRICIYLHHVEGVQACIDMGARITQSNLFEKTTVEVREILWREFRWRNRKAYLCLLSRGELKRVPGLERVPVGLLGELVGYL